MPAFKTQTISGWGRFPQAEAQLYRPERTSEIKTILREHTQAALIARGNGRSYGDASLNSGNGVVLTERVNRFLAFDETTGLVTCEAGVLLKDILDVFLPRGWFLPVTPGTKFPTIGGSVACDVHGKNHHGAGSISRHVEFLDLLLASGEIVRCSQTENSDLFWATAGGMGLTGIILTVALRLQRIETAYISVDFVRTRNLDETIELCEARDDSYRYSVCWIDCLASGNALGRGVLMWGEHARLDQLPSRLAKNPLQSRKKRDVTVPFTFPNWAINPLTVKLFNFGYYHQHPKERNGAIVDYDTYFYPLDSVLEWNKIYGSRGFVQYQCAFPLEVSRKALTQTLEVLSRHGLASFLAVLKRFGPQEGLLSFPLPGYTLALDIPFNNPNLLETLNRLDALVVAEGGRIYLGKDARMSAGHFAQMYPNLEKWRAIKRKVDPENVFSSDLSRRIGLSEF
ncbi:MAG: FAD-binding oxidoreductase [Blastocatellia bacterium]|nr:FAD-binding oxidoreductase [Blastocatellia bacterium]